MQSQLSKDIFRTIAYYDILNFPLTPFEIWKYLIAEKKCTLGDVFETLESQELKNRIEVYRGFHFLRGRKDLVERRIQNDKNSIEKYKIAEKVAGWLKYVPFVRMVSVTGTLAMRNCERNSDIDFFVVLKKGRIFMGRTLVTGMAHLLGRRRHGKKIKNRICLNYFVTTDGLEIERKDLFASNEYAFIYPIFGWDIFQDFCRANAEWIIKFKPNWDFGLQLKPARYFVEVLPRQRAVQSFFEGLINLMWGDRIESWLKRKQITRIERNPLTQKTGAYIVANERNLIFLPVPQGVRIEEEWQRRRGVLDNKK